MSASNPTGQRPDDRAAGRQAGAILTIALLAALLLVVAEFTTIASVKVDGESCEVLNDADPSLADRCSLSGWERHGGALLLLALAAGGIALAARRRTTAAVGAVLLAVGVVTLGIALIADLPVTNDTGAVGRDFDGATASAGLGFYAELLGGALCVVAGAAALLAVRRDRQTTAPDER
jgi:hypothetical protein